MKNIEIIPLARKKLTQRKIKDEWIKEVISNPDQKVKGYGGRFVAQKLIEVKGKEKLLRVVYEETSSVSLVITAYLTSQIERYWRKGL